MLIDQNNEEQMLGALDRVMRLLRWRPTERPHGGRGVFRMLRLIELLDGISTRDLADRLDVRPSSLNEKLAGLEAKGLIQRDRDDKDQRVFVVRLLPRGRQHLEHLRQERTELADQLAGILTPEETAELTHLAQKLAAGLEEREHQERDSDSASEKGAPWT